MHFTDLHGIIAYLHVISGSRRTRGTQRNLFAAFYPHEPLQAAIPAGRPVEKEYL